MTTPIITSMALNIASSSSSRPAGSGLAYADVAKAIDVSTLAEVVELEELPDLDFTALAVYGRVRHSLGRLQRLFARTPLAQRVTTDELFRFRERAVGQPA